MDIITGLCLAVLGTVAARHEYRLLQGAKRMGTLEQAVAGLEALTPLLVAELTEQDSIIEELKASQVSPDLITRLELSRTRLTDALTAAQANDAPLTPPDTSGQTAIPTDLGPTTGEAA